MPGAADVVGMASPSHAERLAKQYTIPRFFTDYREMLRAAEGNSAIGNLIWENHHELEKGFHAD